MQRDAASPKREPVSAERVADQQEEHLRGDQHPDDLKLELPNSLNCPNAQIGSKPTGDLELPHGTDAPVRKAAETGAIGPNGMGPDEVTADEVKSDAALRSRFYRLAYALSGRPDRADDILQQAYATVLSRDPTKIRHIGYMRQAIVHAWMNDRTSSARRWRRLLHWFRGYSSSTAAHHKYDDCGGFNVESSRITQRVIDGSQAAEHLELVDQVKAAVHRLPPQQRAVLTLRLMEELSYEEIAEITGLKVNVVRSHLHVARKRVRDVIEDDQS
ncbi:MAG: RNA polymerase sigma factor [Phycisphaerae bacterium]